MGAAVIVATIAAGAIYQLTLGGSTVEAHLAETPATSVIGTGDEAVGVSSAGVILAWQPPPADGTLPRLPLDTPPKQGVLAGPVLAQARVLGAAPPVLRSCIDSSYYGESGVDVILSSGIELRFGDASRAARKWSSAAAILADPSTTDIGYVDLHSPGRASTGGSGHALPPAEPGAGTSCGE
jgi:cell division septal protein FtsQ